MLPAHGNLFGSDEDDIEFDSINAQGIGPVGFDPDVEDSDGDLVVPGPPPIPADSAAAPEDLQDIMVMERKIAHCPFRYPEYTEAEQAARALRPAHRSIFHTDVNPSKLPAPQNHAEVEKYRLVLTQSRQVLNQQALWQTTGTCCITNRVQRAALLALLQGADRQQLSHWPRDFAVFLGKDQSPLGPRGVLTSLGNLLPEAGGRGASTLARLELGGVGVLKSELGNSKKTVVKFLDKVPETLRTIPVTLHAHGDGHREAKNLQLRIIPRGRTCRQVARWGQHANSHADLCALARMDQELPAARQLYRDILRRESFRTGGWREATHATAMPLRLAHGIMGLREAMRLPVPDLGTGLPAVLLGIAAEYLGAQETAYWCLLPGPSAKRTAEAATMCTSWLRPVPGGQSARELHQQEHWTDAQILIHARLRPTDQAMHDWELTTRLEELPTVLRLALQSRGTFRPLNPDIFVTRVEARVRRDTKPMTGRTSAAATAARRKASQAKSLQAKKQQVKQQEKELAAYWRSRLAEAEQRRPFMPQSGAEGPGAQEEALHRHLGLPRQVTMPSTLALLPQLALYAHELPTAVNRARQAPVSRDPLCVLPLGHSGVPDNQLRARPKKKRRRDLPSAGDLAKVVIDVSG